jgi:hypothetical protein
MKPNWGPESYCEHCIKKNEPPKPRTNVALALRAIVLLFVYVLQQTIFGRK